MQASALLLHLWVWPGQSLQQQVGTAGVIGLVKQASAPPPLSSSTAPSLGLARMVLTATGRICWSNRACLSTPRLLLHLWVWPGWSLQQQVGTAGVIGLGICKHQTLLPATHLLLHLWVWPGQSLQQQVGSAGVIELVFPPPVYCSISGFGQDGPYSNR